MHRNTILALNALWATAAVGAFFLGKGATDAPSESDSRAADAVAPGQTAGGVSAISGQGAGSVSGTEGSAGGAAGADPAADAGRRMTAALSDSDPLRRKALIAEMLVNLTPEQVPGILAAFEEGERNDETNRLFRDFLYAWGRVGGEDALAYMMDPESPRRDHYGGTSAVAGWAAVDQVAAKDYVAAVENKHAKEWLHYGVFREQLRSDLDGAIAYSEENFLSRARGRQMDLIRDEILKQGGVDGLVDWVESIDHTDESGDDLLAYKRYANSIMLESVASEDPEAAMAWISENASAPFLSADGLERAARRAGGEIDEELAWLVGLPEEVAERGHAIGERFEDFIRSDFDKAGAWLAAQPLGPAFDEAIQDFARSAARRDQDAARAWAERISDPKIREDTLRRIPPPAGASTSTS